MFVGPLFQKSLEILKKYKFIDPEVPLKIILQKRKFVLKKKYNKIKLKS